MLKEFLLLTLESLDLALESDLLGHDATDLATGLAVTKLVLRRVALGLLLLLLVLLELLELLLLLRELESEILLANSRNRSDTRGEAGLATELEGRGKLRTTCGTDLWGVRLCASKSCMCCGLTTTMLAWELLERIWNLTVVVDSRRRLGILVHGAKVGSIASRIRKGTGTERLSLAVPGRDIVSLGGLERLSGGSTRRNGVRSSRRTTCRVGRDSLEVANDALKRGHCVRLRTTTLGLGWARTSVVGRLTLAMGALILTCLLGVRAAPLTAGVVIVVVTSWTANAWVAGALTATSSSSTTRRASRLADTISVVGPSVSART